MRGGPDAFEKIVGDYGAGVVSVALNILGNREDAEDACQERIKSILEKKHAALKDY